MTNYRQILNIFYCNLLWNFINLSKSDDESIFMVGSSKFYIHNDVNSYFGYSISSYIGQGRPSCLVGAPREVIDEEIGDKESNTGAVLSVSLDTDDCQRLPISTRNSEDQTKTKIVSGYTNWLGGSVSTALNGNDAVQLGCDPRFISKTLYGVNKTEQQLLGIGQCSLYTGASMESTTIQPCSSIDEGACLSGFSSSVFVDENGIIKVALGLPGSFLTEGNVFLGSYKGKDIIDKVKLKTSPMDLKNRGYNLGYSVQLTKLWLKKDLKSPFTNVFSNDVVVTSSTVWKSNEYRGVVMVLDSKLDMSQIVYINDINGHLGSNFGASIATGDFNGDGILDIAVGSPFFTDHWTSSKRLVDIGAVHVFYGLVSNNQKYAVSEYHEILKGNKERGNFGMSMTTLGDIDGDNKDDFAIGCPNCGEDSTGSVYIYLGGYAKPVQIIRPRDLNHVPLVPLCLININIEDNAILRPFQNFGWSLTGQFDLDRNSVPDILVGDYASAQIVYLRSKNIVWLENSRWLLPTSNAIDWTDSVQSSLPCMGDICRYYISLKADVFGRRMLMRNKLTFKVKVDLDSEIKIESQKRIQFVSTGKSVIHQNVLFKLRISNNSVEIFAAVIEPRFEAIKNNIWQPLFINVTVSHTTSDETDDQLSNISPWMLHPFKGEKYFVSTKKLFKNLECGLDNDCVSDIRVFITDWSLYNTHKTNIFYKEKYKERKVIIGIGNWGENAFNVKLKIIIPSVLEFQGLTGQNCTLSVSKDATNVIATCHFANPFINNQNNVSKLFLTLNTGGAFRAFKKMKSNNGMVLTIKVEGSCGNLDLDLSNNVASVEYLLQISGSVKITPKHLESTLIDSRNFSTKVSEFQRVYPETLGPSFIGIYIITNSGPSPIENINLKISVPFKTENGEYILYFLRRINQQDTLGNPLTISQLPEVISIKGPAHGKCRISSHLVDPYNLNTIERNHISNDRKKRSNDAKKHVISASSQLLKLRTRNQEIINCNNSRSVFGKLECLEIQCTVFNLTLQSEVQIIIQARIWAETFFQYKISDSLIYASIFGQIQPQSYGFNVSGDLMIAPINTSHNIIFKGIEDLTIGHVPLWPIILGILLGLLFLTFIILMLWKCGFFRRHRQFKAEIIEDYNNQNNGYSSRYKNSYSTAHL